MCSFILHAMDSGNIVNFANHVWHLAVKSANSSVVLQIN